MSRFPGLEAKILKTLEEEGEMRPPDGRLGQEWFWQAAAQLQARGLAVADQRAGVVRRPAASEPLTEHFVTLPAPPSNPAPSPPSKRVTFEVRSTDLRARCVLLIQRWRQAEDETRGIAGGSVWGRCAVALGEVLEETL